MRVLASTELRLVKVGPTMVVFGGYTGTGYSNETFVLELEVSGGPLF